MEDRITGSFPLTLELRIMRNPDCVNESVSDVSHGLSCCDSDSHAVGERLQSLVDHDPEQPNDT